MDKKIIATDVGGHNDSNIRKKKHKKLEKVKVSNYSPIFICLSIDLFYFNLCTEEHNFALTRF